ncbi:MAG: AMP-binding protein, partial [Planctomycetales bacterium]|nr:AMP-binding protein [Planctomycetales bacterium]
MNISVEQLVTCGLSREEAESWSTQLQDWTAACDEPLRWKKITTHLLTPAVPFAVHELLYAENYPQLRKRQLPCPAWFPQPNESSATHVAQWLADLGLANYEELHAWSVSHQEEFAAKLTAALSIRFHRPAGRCCDTSAGIENVRWFPQATMNIVESCFQADDDALAVIAGDQDNQLEYLTYAQLKALTARVANGLVELGLQPGDRVAISMPMTADAVAAFLGIIAAGCAVVTIADSFSANEMAVRLEITQPKWIFIQDEIIRNGKSLPLLEKLANQETVRAIVLRASSSRAIGLRPGDVEWEDFLSADSVLRCVPRCPEDETTILFSSGTTGHPKAIPWNQTTPIKSASDAYFHQDIRPADILCWPTNLGWMM